MSNKLVIPSATSPVPAGWAERTAAEVAEIEDLQALNEGASQLDAAITYFKGQRQNAGELQKAKAYVEIRIGELLGAGEHGGDRSKSVTPNLLTKDQRHELRQLAWREGECVADEAREAVAEGATSRRAVLKAIAPPPTPDLGVRKTQQQERLIDDVVYRMELIETTIDEIDLPSANQLPKEKRQAWLLRLKSAQRKITQLKNGLE